MTRNRLKPLSPEEAVNLYLGDRRNDLAKKTLDSYRYRLQFFVQWCEEEGMDNLNDLDGRDLLAFKEYRSHDLSTVSLKAQMDTFRSFLRFCESIDAVEPDLHDKVLSPSIKEEDRQRDVLLESDRASEILKYLSRFEYASLHHTLLTLLWKTGARTGTVNAFDLSDYDPDNQRIETVHRPETETPLKTGRKGQRLIALGREVCHVLNDYIDHTREDVTDEYGREPLFTISFGRVSKSTVRETAYKWTRPCQYNGGECPHGKTPDSCQAVTGPDKAPSVCPSTRSPHAWRRGAITHYLTEDVPTKVVSDRMNVSPEVLEKHYDRRSEEVKVEQRREYLDEV